MDFPHIAQSFFLMIEILSKGRNLNAARNLMLSIQKNAFMGMLNYGKAGLFQESVQRTTNMARSVFGEMLSTYGLTPDVYTSNILIKGVGKVGIAHNMVKGMSKKSLVLNANVATYTTLVRGYCLNQDFDEALIVFQEMICKGLKLDKIYSECMLFQHANKCTLQCWKHRCSFECVQKDVGIGGAIRFSYYSAIIGSLCQIGNFEKAEEFFDELA
ncbi:hypothetical protein V6N13_140133 [Hibiscus sabdariffa]